MMPATFIQTRGQHLHGDVGRYLTGHVSRARPGEAREPYINVRPMLFLGPPDSVSESGTRESSKAPLRGILPALSRKNPPPPSGGTHVAMSPRKTDRLNIKHDKKCQKSCGGATRPRRVHCPSCSVPRTWFTDYVPQWGTTRPCCYGNISASGGALFVY